VDLLHHKRCEENVFNTAKIKVVMNDMLKKYEDFGGIEDVFFTSFVMQ